MYVSQSLEEQYITKETANRIKKLLSKKDERTQKVVKMRVEGYSYAEIADKVNISEGSARVINFRTKKWIKEVLEEEGGS